MTPGRRQRSRRVVFCCRSPIHREISLVSSLQPQYAVIGLDVLRATGEIVKGPGRHINEHTANKFGPLARALHRILDAAFPFKHGPARETMLRQLREDALEVDLSIAYTAEAPGAIFPVLIATIDPRPGRGMILGILDVESANMVFIAVQVADVVQALQDEVGGVVQDMHARVIAGCRQEAFEGDAVMQVFTWMNLVGQVDTVFFRLIEQGQPAFRQLLKAQFYQARWTLRPGIDGMP